MSTHTARPAVDLAPSAPARPGLALALALIALPGVTLTWDLVPGGGFLTGVPFALAAVVLGVQARGRLAGATGRRLATSAVVIAALALFVVAACMAAYALS